MHPKSRSSATLSYAQHTTTTTTTTPNNTTDTSTATTTTCSNSYTQLRLPKMDADDNNSNMTPTNNNNNSTSINMNASKSLKAQSSTITTNNNNDPFRESDQHHRRTTQNTSIHRHGTTSSSSSSPNLSRKPTGLRRLSRAGSTLFRPKTTIEPKITLEDMGPGERNASLSAGSGGGGSLLSKLSKSTAPMRAKLSAISVNNLGVSLRPESSVSLSIPLRRSAESIYSLANNNHATSSSATTGQQRSSSSSSSRRLCGERSHSFSFSNPTLTSTNDSTIHNTSSATSAAAAIMKERIPLVYPALLSKVAEAFRDRVTVGPRMKDSIEYQNAFDGREADKLAYIIKTTDRNLAVLLGRALDAQKFFHDVNYEHRLRDSRHELYQFQERINAIQSSSNAAPDSPVPNSPVPTEAEDIEDHRSDVANIPTATTSTSSNPSSRDDTLPNGVFTVLTDCYSPTCSREALCYSPSCPRRLEQARSSRSRHARSSSKSSLLAEKEDRLWIRTVPRSLIESMTKDEIRRQENIYELIYTEKDFVDDLMYLKNFWINPLLDEPIISPYEEERREFVQQVFWNVMDVYKVNSALLQALLRRQAAGPTVFQVGDVMLKYVEKFEPFVRYGAHQVIGKYVFESEKSSNPEFTMFVQKTERLKHSRKLELNGYLTKPTTRLGRYNLLLREIVKHTPPDHPDHSNLEKAMTIIGDYLTKVNRETGKMESKHSLHLLNQRLINRHAADMVDLGLQDEGRQLVMKGTLKKKGSGSEASDVHLFLLDHYLVIIKQKVINNVEQCKFYRKPIPLMLLLLSLPDQAKRASSILPYSRSSKDSFTSIGSLDSIGPPSPRPSTSNTTTASNPTTTTTSHSNTTKSGYPLSFSYLGKHGAGTTITLYAATMAIRRQWITKIQQQQQELREQTRVLEPVLVNDTFFSAFNRVRCAAVFDHGKSIAFGSDQGVYVLKDTGGLVRILAIEKVSQIDILDRIILVLADKVLYSYSLDTLLTEPEGGGQQQQQLNITTNTTSAAVAAAANRRGRRISSHVSFFKIGKIQDSKISEKTLVCFVRQNAMSSTIRALEPHETLDPKKKHNHLGRLIRSNPNDPLKVYKDLYIPGVASSIQFFRNIICVGCPKGFQMVDLASTEVQSVLDPSDERHYAITQRENLKPISMFRHENGNILLCYNEIAFYIDKKGRRVHEDWMITWEGNPVAFAYRFPYIIAFEPTFVEVRHMDTGHLLQIIPGTNIRCLKPDAHNTIHCVMDDRITGNEMIFELKLL
ncbi:cnh-domain-containing protein [Lichtheimia corymbifera JMRC:FSU:9682]|uniref:Cnh-domain-containing protein n=1 Tax=Lichtheimia corymbifera JMRC:FSU:9682 TaxID=1263082 RepID=A0A068RZ14_9FUNG|nr:cnh-domain-containing protein [Lichtheimia corymbifera JMRC:FSU:9682]